MAVGNHSEAYEIVPGVRLASTACGIKGDGSPDLVMFEFAPGSHSAGVFTQSLFAAAPVVLARDHLKKAATRYFLVNSGNANAAVGEAGMQDAHHCCAALSQVSGALPEQVLPFSTGVIGERLPVEKIVNQLAQLNSQLDEDNWLLAAKGIMTTDTRPKIATRSFLVGDEKIVITGIAKGAGMIQPNMATMLSYVATNLTISETLLQTSLEQSVNKSFNRITVDSDTSTNDSCMLTSTNMTNANCDDSNVLATFVGQLDSLMLELAHGIVRDAEGATKFIEVCVKNAATADDGVKIAYSVANSPLMKTALFASDANWGRIVMAIGKADVAIDISKLDVFLGDVQLMRSGEKDPSYTEEAGSAVMALDEITITIDLHAGSQETRVWTSDLSHEYVTINAEYRT